MDCHLEENKRNCNCTNNSCPRKGACCQCLAHHLGKRELPACCFTAEAERTYDRSFSHFADLVEKGRV